MVMPACLTRGICDQLLYVLIRVLYPWVTEPILQFLFTPKIVLEEQFRYHLCGPPHTQNRLIANVTFYCTILDRDHYGK